MAAGTKIQFHSGYAIAGVDERSSTLTVKSAGTGQTKTGGRASRNVRAVIDRMMRIVSGTITFDSSYPTGGEDISEIWRMFRPMARDASRTPTAWDLRSILFEQPNNGKLVQLDKANKKLKVVTAFAGTEATNASDQSAVSVDFIAIGT